MRVAPEMSRFAREGELISRQNVEKFLIGMSYCGQPRHSGASRNPGRMRNIRTGFGQLQTFGLTLVFLHHGPADSTMNRYTR